MKLFFTVRIDANPKDGKQLSEEKIPLEVEKAAFYALLAVNDDKASPDVDMLLEYVEFQSCEDD